MRSFLLSLTLTVALMLSAACGSSEQANTSAGNAGAAQPANVRTTTTPAARPATDGLPVAVSHGAPPAPPSGAGGPAAGGASGPDTSALDAQIEQAEAKAKAAGATAADKKAAAEAYLARANVLMFAGSPMLYKFALRDFRRTLKYDPANALALERKQEIERIYKSMGRPIPELGNEP
jgi:hypothetical protein